MKIFNRFYRLFWKYFLAIKLGHCQFIVYLSFVLSNPHILKSLYLSAFRFSLAKIGTPSCTTASNPCENLAAEEWPTPSILYYWSFLATVSLVSKNLNCRLLAACVNCCYTTCIFVHYYPHGRINWSFIQILILPYI